MSLWNLSAAINDTKFLWDIMAPLGGPVVPEVYEKVMISSGTVLNYSNL